jgi:hypothetical protein
MTIFEMRSTGRFLAAEGRMVESRGPSLANSTFCDCGDMNEDQLAAELLHFALESSVAIGIASKVPSEDPDSFRSATGALVQLYGRPLLVTNWHVIQRYRELSQMRETQFFFADRAIDPLPRLQSENQDLDLALIRADGLRLRADRNRNEGIPDLSVYEPQQWPPAPPQVGDSVFFSGWPEVARSVDVPTMEATFQPYGYLGATIADVTEMTFTVHFDRTSVRGVTGRETHEQIHENELSGLSGTPIFRDMSRQRKPHELVGFIKRFAKAWDTFLATSASHIREDLSLSVDRQRS